MIIRAVDENNDWTFGKGKNDYLSGNNAIAQNIKTRILCFLGDCFFDTFAGIDWFNFIGGKNTLQLNLAISSVILNTAYVTGILQLSINLTSARVLTIVYKAQTTYSTIGSSFQYDFASANIAA